MSTFVSNDSQNRVAKTNVATFKLKVTDDATNYAMQNAIQACHKSARFSHNDGGNVRFDNGSMDITFIDSDGNIENASNLDTLVVQQPSGIVEHSATNDGSDNDSLFDELNQDEANFVAASIDGATQKSASPETEDTFPAYNDVSMKSCARSDGTRYTVGRKGPVKTTRSNMKDAEISEVVSDIYEEDADISETSAASDVESEVSGDGVEDEVVDSFPTRGDIGMKGCARSDRTRYTFGAKGPIQSKPPHIEDAEISDSDESDDDLVLDENERQELVKNVREEIEQILDDMTDISRQMAIQQNIILKKRLQARLYTLHEAMRLKLALVEESEATEAESVNISPQCHTSSGKNSISENIGNINGASDDKSTAS